MTTDMRRFLNIMNGAGASKTEIAKPLTEGKKVTERPLSFLRTLAETSSKTAKPAPRAKKPAPKK